MPDPKFSWVRMLKLLALEIATGSRRLMVTAIVIALSVVFADFVLAGLLKFGKGILLGAYWGSLFIVGLFLTVSLGESGGALRTGSFYYTMPLTIPEKFISRFLLTGPVFFLLFHAVFLLVALFSGVLVNGLTDVIRPLIFLPDVPFYQVAGFYFLLHAVYFCGGLLFRKNAFGLTTVIMLATILGAIVLLLAVFHLGGFYANVPHVVGQNKPSQFIAVVLAPSPYPWANRLFAYAFLMPLLWFAGYRLFKEREL